MTKRGGFGSYMVANGLTNIERVRLVLDRIADGSRARVASERQLRRAGLDARQAAALVGWAIAEATREKVA